MKRSEPDGVRPATRKAVGGISTKQSGGEKPPSAARLKKLNVCLVFLPCRLRLLAPVFSLTTKKLPETTLILSAPKQLMFMMLVLIVNKYSAF